MIELLIMNRVALRFATTARSIRARPALLWAAGASVALLVYAGTPAAYAANCVWNDATANWTTPGDWSNCNGTIPGSGDTVTIPVGEPTLTTAATVGSVTISSPTSWDLVGSGAKAVVTGDVANAGALNVDIANSDGGGNLTITG